MMLMIAPLTLTPDQIVIIIGAAHVLMFIRAVIAQVRSM